MPTTQEELLLFLLVPYINSKLGTSISIKELLIKYIENDQNSKSAFHIFSNDLYNSFNLRIYIQYDPSFSLSQFYFEDSKNDNGEDISFLLNSTEVNFSLLGSDPVNLLISVLLGDDFYNLPSGNILPIDYVFENIVTNPNEKYNILLLDDNVPLLINGTAVMIKEN